MQRRESIIAALLTATALLLPAAAAAQETQSTAGGWKNRQPDGTYVLTTNNLRSIQAYYRDVGAGRLFLAGAQETAAMRETCLTLGRDWRPLGHVNLPDSKGEGSYPLSLCYYSAPNPDSLARAKCANLGLALRENRREAHEIVCGPPKRLTVLRGARD